MMFLVEQAIAVLRRTPAAGGRATALVSRAAGRQSRGLPGGRRGWTSARRPTYQ
jgi:hypothetical protein